MLGSKCVSVDHPRRCKTSNYIDLCVVCLLQGNGGHWTVETDFVWFFLIKLLLPTYDMEREHACWGTHVLLACVSVCPCVSVCACGCVCVHVCLYVCVYIYIYPCVYLRVCECIWVSACLHVRPHVCMHECNSYGVHPNLQKTDGMADEGRHGISAFSQFLWLSDSKELFQNSPQRDFGNQGKSQKQKLELWTRSHGVLQFKVSLVKLWTWDVLFLWIFLKVRGTC